MKKQKPLLFNLLIIFGTFTLGIVISRLVSNWPVLTLKYEVDVLQTATDIITLLVTIWIAFWVTQSLERSKESDRVEKDLYIGKFDELYVFIEETEVVSAAAEIDYHEILARFKRIQTKHNTLFKHLETSQVTLLPNLKSTGNTFIKDVKDLLTLTPVISSTSPPVTISNNKITLSPDRKSEVSLAYDKLKNHIFNMEIFLNRA